MLYFQTLEWRQMIPHEELSLSLSLSLWWYVHINHVKKTYVPVIVCFQRLAV